MILRQARPRCGGATMLVVALGLLGTARGAVAQSSGSPYRIGQRDLVRVSVFEAEDLDVERRVRSDGTIQLPLLGDVFAEGLTGDELARKIKQGLEASFLQRASVTVEIPEIRSRPVRVIGAVTKPGDLTFADSTTLLEVLTEAGGLSGQRGGVIQVNRRADNGLSDRLEVRMEDLLSGDPSVWNVPVYPSDVINVLPGSPMTIYLLGEVDSKGAMEFPQGQRVTLLKVLARAGGLSERASKNILIKREGEDGTLSEIEVSYKRILDGKDPDVELEPGDLILVRKSLL